MIITVYTYLPLWTLELVKKCMRITLPLVGLFKIWMTDEHGIEVARFFAALTHCFLTLNLFRVKRDLPNI
jgi:hypothetical protein